MMATHNFMRGGYPGAKARRAKQTRTKLEIALTVAGIAAWIWCAYEVARAILG